MYEEFADEEVHKGYFAKKESILRALLFKLDNASFDLLLPYGHGTLFLLLAEVRAVHGEDE